MTRNLILTVCMVLSCTAHAQVTSRLSDLLNTRRLHEMQHELMKVKDQPAIYHLYNAALQTAWMQADSSRQSLQKISKKQLTALPDTLQFMYHSLMLDNAIKSFEYKIAAAHTEILSNDYSKFFKDEELNSMKEANIIWVAAKNEKKQQIIHHDTSVMSVKRDLAGLMNIRVTSGDSSFNFVFDTGAGISTIMESYAKKLQLVFLENAELPVRSGITGIPTQSRLAMARKLTIGNMEVHNTLFLVFPDSALTFAKGLYKINGIIGFPIIKEMGEITFRKDTLYIAGRHMSQAGERNLAVDNLKPYFFLEYNGDKLPFTFDTGAGHSIFSDVFYRKYQQFIDSTGKAVKQSLGGTNGTKVFAGFTMPSLTFNWNGHDISLKNVFVSSEELRATGKYYYGNIGKDFINSFRSMTMDFNKSHISFSIE